MGDYTIGIGTVGAGMHFSYDGGAHWRHIYKHVNPEGNVRSLRVFPDDPHHVLAASDRAGLFQSRDNGYLWEPLESPIIGCEIWSLAIDPGDPDRIYVGARPGGFRSTDGGATWERMDMGIGDECPIGVPRITNMVVDPRNHHTVWAGVEVGGVYRSHDGGDTWHHLDDIGPTPFHGDIHGLAVRTGDRPEVLAGTPFGVATSSDDGETWAWRDFEGFGDVGSGNPFAYCRGVFVLPDDPETVLVGCGDYIPGQVGAIEVSHDGGASFSRAATDTTPNSTVYWMATHPDLPAVVVAVTVFGQVFVSDDRGDSWSKLGREFGEIRAVSLSPN
ncbi:MAG: WD40/YVTN/BNR-like repeat-containing protein [Acidimicrobiales bacterium]